MKRRKMADVYLCISELTHEPVQPPDFITNRRGIFPIHPREWFHFPTQCGERRTRIRAMSQSRSPFSLNFPIGNLADEG